MFFRTKPAGSYHYLQIVHSVREGKKVRQQVIATLGRLDLLEASGQLERLMRSPADVEIGSATRDANLRTLTFTPSVLNGNFFVQNTVVNRIQTKTGGDGSITGEEVEITIQFTTPIILP